AGNVYKVALRRLPFPRESAQADFVCVARRFICRALSPPRMMFIVLMFIICRAASPPHMMLILLMFITAQHKRGQDTCQFTPSQT
ncbi:MAG TPA: hypothetical protein VFG99_05135, partial [Chloroflexia bacterium]|nr:hypothetical protein [Chloroflexia bacterium]